MKLITVGELEAGMWIRYPFSTFPWAKLLKTKEVESEIVSMRLLYLLPNGSHTVTILAQALSERWEHRSPLRL